MLVVVPSMTSQYRLFPRLKCKTVPAYSPYKRQCCTSVYERRAKITVICIAYCGNVNNKKQRRVTLDDVLICCSQVPLEVVATDDSILGRLACNLKNPQPRPHQRPTQPAPHTQKCLLNQARKAVLPTRAKTILKRSARILFRRLYVHPSNAKKVPSHAQTIAKPMYLTPS